MCRMFRFSWVRLGRLTALALLLFGLLPFRAVQADSFNLPVDEVAVKLKPNVDIQTILTRYNATQLGVLAETKLYFLKLNGQSASDLLPSMNADPDLYYAEPNYYYEALSGELRYIGGRIACLNAELRYIGGRDAGVPAPTGDPNWAWQRVNRDDADKIATGQGVIVAILDTGLASDHALLQSSLTSGYDFVAMKSQILDQGNGIDDDGDGELDEQTGHGTHVAGIILSAAPGVQIMPIRVLNSDGIGTYWEVAAGIRYAVDHGAKVINLSLSAPLLPESLNSAVAYAAEHNVLLVAAAGDGPGPNYPAGYSNKLSVLGVGATDTNDAVAWFSGGFAQDVDIYAPGMNIYSSFPYDEYVYASGTSMSSPMIAAEAALLISKHPTWSIAQVAQRILDTGVPIGQAAGRADLGAALTTGLEVHYRVGDLGSAYNSMIAPRLLLVNNTPLDKPLNELTLRYWYTMDGTRPQFLSCDYASLSSCGSVFGNFYYGLPMVLPGVDAYAQVGFAPQAGLLPAGEEMELLFHFYKDNWESYDELNDYSYIDGQSAFLPAPQISLYANGTLAWGNEPVAGIPLPQPTPTFGPTQMPSPAASVAPSPTSTQTVMPQPSATQAATQQPTATKTSTPQPTSTKTATPQPAATKTATTTAQPTIQPPSATVQAPTATSQAGLQPVVIYDDATSWDNWSWSTAVDFGSTTYVHGGAKSLAFTFNSGWAGLSLHRSSPLNIAGYQQFTFWIYPSGSGTRQLLFFVHNNVNGESESTKVGFSVTAGQWTQVTVPLSSLGNPVEISRVNIQECASSAQAAMYVDDLKIIP